MTQAREATFQGPATGCLTRTSLSALLPTTKGQVDQHTYNPQLADKAISFPGVVFKRRFWQLLLYFVSFFLTAVANELSPILRSAKEKSYKARAVALRQLLTNLGPTFIKLGQFLSVRRDLLPEEIAVELSLLQDKVPPSNLDLIKQTINLDLGDMPESLFLSFEEIPLASASIGQVHLVKLKGGQTAAVKVQRPDLAEIFYQDLGLMRLFARLYAFASQLFCLFVPGQAPFDLEAWLKLADELGRRLFVEIDYLREGRNADRIRRLMRYRTEVRIPRVYWKYTGRRVLTLEYIEATKIDKIAELKKQGFDLEELANLLTQCYLEQFLRAGFFHADPHAGNLAIDKRANLVIYDFGMVGEVGESDRKALLSCLFSAVRHDAYEVVRNLVELGVVNKDADLLAVTRMIKVILEYYAGVSLASLDLKRLEKDLDKVIEQKSLHLPAHLSYLLRASSGLEGITRTLKPNFNFIASLGPIICQWAFRENMESLMRSEDPLETILLALKNMGRTTTSTVPLSNADVKPATLLGKANISKPKKQLGILKIRLQSFKKFALLLLVSCANIFGWTISQTMGENP